MTHSGIRLLFHRQWQENARSYFVGTLALLVLFGLAFAITWHFRNSFAGDTSRGIFLLGLFAGGSIFASSIFRDLASPSKAVWQICLPASISEKVFVAFIFGVPGYLLCFLGSFYGVEYLSRSIISNSDATIPPLDLSKNGFYTFIYSFVNLQLLLMTGSMLFKKASYLKSLLIIISSIAVVNYLNGKFLAILTNEQNINGSNVFTYFQFVHQGENVYVNLPENIDAGISLFFHFVLPAILYSIMYYKLKEKELR